MLRPHAVSRSERQNLQRQMKRGLDVLGSLVLMITALPLFVFAALAILVTSGRPILYRRQVLGLAGQFDAFKFRTMKPDADRILAADPMLNAEFVRNFKLKCDPRITRVGAFLRKKSLDELPQLFNVLRGEMSLVGPRMITAQELSKYGAHGEVLLSVKPGLTGYWQVNGRQNVSYEERVAMDVRYIREWSLAMDLKILAQTPLRVLKGEGAI
jgi:lipopolysaccharide/colanic/teichoic acid biosynthesis glycosyltransferase